MADCINEWGRELNIEGIAEVLDILQSRYLSGCMVWKEAVHREMPGF